MAKRTITLLVDDMDGGEADQSIPFGLDGMQYTIDLSDRNAKTLREALEPFVASGRRLGRVTTSPRAPQRSTSSSSSNGSHLSASMNQSIRDWATAKGIAVADRGRISPTIVDRYRREVLGVRATTADPAPEPEPTPEPVPAAANGGSANGYTRTEIGFDTSDKAIRKWAKERKIDVAPRGKVAPAVRERYLDWAATMHGAPADSQMVVEPKETVGGQVKVTAKAAVPKVPPVSFKPEKVPGQRAARKRVAAGM